MKSYKLISLALAAVMALSLCSCAQGQKTEPASTEPVATESAETGKIDLSSCEDSPEWVTELPEAKDAEQLFVIAAIGRTTATISMHQKDADGNWNRSCPHPVISANGDSARHRKATARLRSELSGSIMPSESQQIQDAPSPISR